MNKISSSNQIFKPKSNLINTKFRSTKSLNKFLSTIQFDCSNRSEGYYADIDLNCRTFHYCKQEQRQFTFNCPGSSQFNQKELTCENNNFENDSNEICQNSTKFFFINQILYNVNGTMNAELKNESKNFITTTTKNVLNQTKLSPPPPPSLSPPSPKSSSLLKYRKKSSSSSTTTIMDDHSIKRSPPLTMNMQIDKPKWYNHRRQQLQQQQQSSIVNGKDQTNGDNDDLPDYSFNKYSFYDNNNDRMTTTTTTTFRPLIIKKYNMSSANLNNNNNKYIINQIKPIQSEKSTTSAAAATTKTLINRIRPIVPTNISTENYFLHRKPSSSSSVFLNDYDFFGITSGNNVVDVDDNNNHYGSLSSSSSSSTYNGISSPIVYQQPLSLQHSIKERESSSSSMKPKSKMDKFLPFTLMNLKERLIRKWNQNFFQKTRQQSKKKNRSNPINVGVGVVVDSRKMENFLFPKTFKHFRSLFSRSKNNFSQNND